MKYTIGEFASLLGISADTLRLYEKYGILQPEKDPTNHYRYYDDLDARAILMSRWFRSMEIPLQNTALLAREANLEQIKASIQGTQISLEEEIAQKTRLFNKVKEINVQLSHLDQLLNQCSVRNLPGIYRLRQTSKNALLKEEYLTHTAHVWMRELPFTFYSFKIESQELFSSERAFEYSWGLAVLENELMDSEMKEKSSIEYIPANTYVSSVIYSSAESYLTKEILRFMMDYIEENNYSITGDIIGKIIVTARKDQLSGSYLEVNIPISKG